MELEPIHDLVDCLAFGAERQPYENLPNHEYGKSWNRAHHGSPVGNAGPVRFTSKASQGLSALHLDRLAPHIESRTRLSLSHCRPATSNAIAPTSDIAN